MKKEKYGLTLNYEQGKNHYFKVSKMWRTLSKNGFIGFGSNYHSGETFRLWSEHNCYLTNSVVICKEILDVDCFIIDDFLSEQICDIDDFVKDYQINKFSIPIINPENPEKLTQLEQIEIFKYEEGEN